MQDQKITLALDWTPNINHIGFFVAKELGYYKEQGLEVELLSPLNDNYQVTPAKKANVFLDWIYKYGLETQHVTADDLVW